MHTHVLYIHLMYWSDAIAKEYLAQTVTVIIIIHLRKKTTPTPQKGTQKNIIK